MRRIFITLMMGGILLSSGNSFAEYVDTGVIDDWGGRDMLCSRGTLPTKSFCDTGAMPAGTVAVCWDGISTHNPNGQPTNLPNGESRRCPVGTNQWCVYKSVVLSMINAPNAPGRISAPARDGTAPGKIYVCQPG